MALLRELSLPLLTENEALYALMDAVEPMNTKHREDVLKALEAYVLTLPTA